MRQGARDLGEQGARPRGPLRDVDAEHALEREREPELAGEGAVPVVPVHQRQALAVVAHLEELLGPAVHRAHLRVGGDDDVVVELEVHAQQAVHRRVRRPEVGHERLGAGDDVHARRERPHSQGHRARRHARIVPDRCCVRSAHSDGAIRRRGAGRRPRPSPR